MRKLYIVKSTLDFNNLIREGKSRKNKYFVLYEKENNLKYSRFGISVGKKIGKAVIRNKYKRKIRSIIDNYRKQYENSKDYIIILRSRALDKPYEDLQRELFSLLNEKETINEK